MAGNKSDPAWDHGEEIKTVELKGKSYKYIKCKYCGKETTGGISRLKNHLAGTRKNVKPCSEVTEKIKKEMINLLKLGEKSRMENERNHEELIDSGSYYQSVNPSAGNSSGGSVSHRGVQGPMDRFVMDIGEENPDINPVNEKEARERCCLDVGRFFFENGISFNVANSPSFINMCRSIGNYGRGFKPPSAYELSHWILDEEVKTTQKAVDEVKLTWTQTGVSILSDGWKDMRGRQLINFLVNNPYGTVFLKSVDASDHVKDARMLCNLLDSVVEEVGEDIVVQVVTDNASNYKAAGNLLMAKRPRLWWTPCAAHCIDLILEKIADLPQHKNALAKSKKVSNYIYNHGWALALMRRFTKRELIRPAVTRFATSYLTLQSMHNLKDSLEEMFVSRDWTSHHMSKTAEAKSVKHIVLRDRFFWPSVSYAIKTTKPLFTVLRMADSEKVPGMGFLYGSMDRAKEEIAKNLGGDPGAYKEIWDIIDKKWEYQMHRDLHAAAYYVNPKYQYDPNMSTHPEIKMGLFNCLAKMFPDREVQEKIHLQMDDFRLRRGFFGHDAAKSTVNKRSPVDWWCQYGDQTPELTAFAVKILSLTCSSSACERNWSTFNQIHTKRRNRLHTHNLNKLVFVMYNKRLKTKWMKKVSLKEGVDPLVMEEIPSDDEWVVDEDASSGASRSNVINEELVMDEGDGDDTRDGDEMGDEDETRDGDGGENVVREEAQSIRSGRGSGRARGQGRGRCQGQKRKRLDKGKGKLHLIDEEDDLESNAILVDDQIDSLDLDLDEDDDDGGDMSGFDPYFKPLDSDAHLFHSSI